MTTQETPVISPAAPAAPPRLSSVPRARHGLENRGLEAGAMPGFGYGRFGRMFPFSGALLPDACLRDIAKAMIKADEGKPLSVSEPVDENPAVPAGYTYFGQFVDHDLSFDPTPLKALSVDTAALEDFRTPALDLDCIYGRGPDDQPYMYEDGVHLRLGRPVHATNSSVATSRDVLRLFTPGEEFAPAILGDKRNDENRLVSQFQSLFIAFHNKVVDDPELLGEFDGSADDDTIRFRTAVKIVRWHYQWLVLHDFLPRLLSPTIVDEVLNPGGYPRLDNYEKDNARWAYIPVEFAGAAYRFGHTMVRPSYALNLEVGAGEEGRIPIFSRGPAAVDNLNGFGVPLPENWALDWSFFFDLDHSHAPPEFQGQLPQPSYRLDAQLVSALADLPEFRAAGDPLANLAYRNLVRGVLNLRLPSGEQVARALGIRPLSPTVLWGAGSRVLDLDKLDDEAREELEETAERRQVILRKWVHGGGAVLRGNTPLWYYVLREAEYYGTDRVAEGPTAGFGGQYLGPVGSRIVAETFVGLIWNDPTSYLRRWPAFEPSRIICPSGPFSLARLAAYVFGC
jgi:hypothetical protein